MLHNLLWSFKSNRQSMAYLMVSFLNYKYMVYLGIFYSCLKVTKGVMYKTFIVKMGYICWCTPKFCFMTFAFLIYVDNVAETILSICRLFADNNSLQQSSYGIYDIEYKLNPSKTKAVYFSRKASPITPKLFFKGDKLECVPVHHHLGLQLSHNLIWSGYIFHSRKIL